MKRAAGWDGENQGWMDTRNVVIVRPSLLTSGVCKADQDSNAYRSGRELQGAWSISRADVAHFVAEKVLASWDEWAGEAWVVSY